MVAFGGCLLFAQTWLREFLFEVGATSLRVNFAALTYPRQVSYVAQTWFARPGGPKLNPQTVFSQMYSAGQPGPWLARRHLSEWISYQPHSHLVWLMLTRNGILVAVAALAVLASVW